MQGNRGRQDPFFDLGDPFAGFGGFGGFGGQGFGGFGGVQGFGGFGGVQGFGDFGGHRSLLPSFFGGRDPFNDPFFTRPFGSMFESSIFGPTGSPFADPHASGFLEHQVPQTNQSRGPIIEELNSDDEREEEGKKEKKDNPRKHGRSSKEPYVEDPDDVAEERESEQMHYRNNFNMLNNARTEPRNHSFTFQSSAVTYGGANGPYYTSSRTRRTGSDGLMIDESKEADAAARQATHRISRGIQDKGHSVSRKLNSDGRVDTMQTLHNLNEDELGGFEEAWNGNARKHLPGWSERLSVHEDSSSSGLASRGGWALPSTQHAQHSGSMEQDVRETAGSSQSKLSGKVKADIGDRTGCSSARLRAAKRTGSSSARLRAAKGVNMDQFGRH